MQRTFIPALIFLCIAAASLGGPVSEGQIDLTFKPNVLGTDWRVSKVATIGRYVYVASATISRLRSDGTLDTSYQCDLATSLINSILPAADGGLIIGGPSYVAKLDSEGKIDPRFAKNQFKPLPPFMGEVRGPYIYKCAVDSKGRIVVQGVFGEINGSQYIARLLPDGTIDPSFRPPTDIMVSAMEVMPDDRIWVGDLNYNGGRLNEDGTLDPSFPRRGCPVMRVLPDGTVAMADRSVSLRDQAGKHLASFNMQFSFDFGVDDVLWDNGKLVVSGLWVEGHSEKGKPHAGILRFNPDGSLDPTWAAPTFSYLDSQQIPSLSRARHLALDAEGRVVAALNNPIQVGTAQTALVRLTANAPTAQPLWHNTSARGRVAPGEPLVVGFVIGGRNQQLLLRAVGPSLARFGCESPLPQPRMAVYRAGALILQRSGWIDSQEYRNAASLSGAFSLENASTDTATITTLPPGAYTLVVSAPDGASGVALGEVYAIDAP